MIDIALVMSCLTLGADPALIDAIIRTESDWNPSAFHVNGWTGQNYASNDRAEAAVAAKVFVDNGYSVDIGLMQINSANLARFDVSVIDAFDVCTNVKLGEAILLDGIERARSAGHHGEQAVKVGLSYYNTGSATAGFNNGYVANAWSNYTARTADEAALSDSVIVWRRTDSWFDYDLETLTVAFEHDARHASTTAGTP